jgi:hypothetical protein
MLENLHVSAVNEKGALACVQGESYILHPIDMESGSAQRRANSRTLDPMIDSHSKSIEACV